MRDLATGAAHRQRPGLCYRVDADAVGQYRDRGAGDERTVCAEGMPQAFAVFKRLKVTGVMGRDALPPRGEVGGAQAGRAYPGSAGKPPAAEGDRPVGDACGFVALDEAQVVVAVAVQARDRSL